MKLFSISFAVALLVGFSNCKPNRSDAQKSTEPTASESMKNAARYLRLQGKIGDLPITMHLLESRRPFDGVQVFSGFYAYDKSTEPISIYGELDSVGQIRLDEASMNETPPFFQGKLAADGSAFNGSWLEKTGQKPLVVSLAAALPAGAIGFSILSFEDSLAAQPNLKDGPKSTVRQEWLVPTASDAAVQAFLEKEIRAGMVGDSLAGLTKSPAEAFAIFKKGAFENYRIELKDWNPADSTDGAMMWMRDDYSSMVVFFNENNLLTLGFTNYSYSGGAHGNYGTSVVSYDLKAKKQLLLADVFKPNYEKKLAVALNRNARRRFGLKPNEPLSTVIFEDEIAPNDNFGLTSKGIFFNYTPYEIASYAQGEIQIFVPFEEIKEILVRE